MNDRVLYLSEIGSLLPRDAVREEPGRKFRSTPLPWLKFRTPGDTTSAGQRYAMRRRAVKADPEGLAIVGVYDEMLAIYGGGRVAPLRGYVVNHHLRPATASEIGAEIGTFDAGLVAHAVRALLAVGLLKIVPMPNFKAALLADHTQAPLDDPPAEPGECFVDETETDHGECRAAAGPNCIPGLPPALADDFPRGNRRRPMVGRGTMRRQGSPSAVKMCKPAGRRPATCRQLPGSGGGT